MNLTDNNMRLRVLEGALRLLGPLGERWQKHSYGCKGGASWCLAGSLAQSAIDLGFVNTKDRQSFNKLADQMTRETSLFESVRQRRYCNVPEFNDARETSFEDVQELLVNRIRQLEGSA